MLGEIARVRGGMVYRSVKNSSSASYSHFIFGLSSMVKRSASLVSSLGCRNRSCIVFSTSCLPKGRYPLNVGLLPKIIPTSLREGLVSVLWMPQFANPRLSRSIARLFRVFANLQPSFDLFET